MKIAELAKRLNIPSKQLLIQVVKLGIPAKSAQTNISDEAQAKVMEVLKASKTIKAAKKAEPAKEKAVKAQKKEKPAAAGEKTIAKKKEVQVKARPKKAEVKTAQELTKTAEKVAKAKEKVAKPAEKIAEPAIKIAEPAIKIAEPAIKIAEPEEKVIEAAAEKVLRLRFPVAVKDLAEKLSVGSGLVIKALMDSRIFATINQLIDEQDAKKVGEKFGYRLERLPTVEEETVALHEKEEEKKEGLLPRSPVVTFMGHVDHGKTSLLDYIRKSKVAAEEAGGITQHIGAYEVVLDKGKITFLDTPGHEAFTAMRARGANATDIVVLVVAADDGIMPQTIEALDHARAAGVPVVVAINKIDKPNIDIDRVKKQLADTGLLAEDWGGKTIAVNVSAKTGEGVDELLEMILLEAEMLELKANLNKAARGVVIEAKVSKGGGPIATVLVQSGTLCQGDIIVTGQYYGKIRALINDRIHRVKEAPPSMPVEILGLNGTPHAGDTFMVVEDEKKAKEIADMRRQKYQEKKSAPMARKITLEDLYSEAKRGKIKELQVILKADVRGSLEAIIDSLAKLSTKDITLNVIHKGVGEINESDILLASVSNAIVIGFNVRKTPEAEIAARQECVDTRLYSIIYELVSDIKLAMEGMLEPHVKEVFMGRILVKQVFKLPKAGIIAGCFVQKGKVARTAICRLIRNGQEVYKGKIASLKRFKDDIKEVPEDFECGIALENFQDIQPGDIIETFVEEKIARKL